MHRDLQFKELQGRTVRESVLDWMELVTLNQIKINEWFDLSLNHSMEKFCWKCENFGVLDKKVTSRLQPAHWEVAIGNLKVFVNIIFLILPTSNLPVTQTGS